MSRSVSPQDTPLAEASINVDNSSSSSSSTSGGGGASSSSCGSDEDDGGDCSRDSFKSESQSSPLVDGPVSSPVPVNGIEVKPCRSIDSISSSENDNDIVRNEHQKERQINNDVQGSSATGQDADFGGKLRFYLDGHCVLELRHDSDDNGQPKKWMQSWGKTYHPPLPTSHPPPPPPPWQPQELPSPESQEDRNPQLPDVATLSVTKNKKKSSNGLMFFSRRRNNSSQPSKITTLPRCILRRAARCPGHAVLSGTFFCTHEKCLNGCKMLNRMASRSTSFQQKSQNIKYIAEDLAYKCVTKERGKELSLNEPSSLDSLLLGALLTPKRENSKPSPVIEGFPPQLDSENKNKKFSLIEEKEKNESNVPIAPWGNADKNSSVSSATNTLGYESSSKHVVQLTAKNKKRVVETSNDNGSLDNSCIAVLKKVKQECDIVSKDDGLSVQIPSSQPYNICSSGSSSVANINLTSGCSRKERDVKAEVLTSDVLPVRESVTRLASHSKGSNNVDIGQPRKKKGGYGRGRTIAESVRAFVISDILNLGGDVRTKYVPRGVFTEVASRYKIDATTTYRWWLKYCNGVRMASNCTSRNTDSSQNSFLPCGSTGGLSYPSVPTGEIETKMIGHYDKLGKQHFHGATTQTSLKIEHFSAVPQARENVQAKSYHHHRASHGDNHSPRSDDSASSGASLVDPASLYASSIAFIPPNGTWQPHLQSVTNGRLSVLTPRMPLPASLSLPYLFNYPSVPQYVNAHSEDLLPINGNKKVDPLNSDEPLDLTLPKQRTRTVEPSSTDTRIQIPNLGRSDPYTFSECPSSKLILKTLLSAHEGQVENDTDNSTKSGRKRKALKTKTKGMDVQLPVEPHSTKPKHYPFASLQIGSFEIHSNLSPNSNYENVIIKENVNKFKVIFNQKKFVYEFEMSAEMEYTVNDGRQEVSPYTRRMACVVVPFSIVEAFWCYDATIILQVISKPCMFLGQRLKQAGCVPSITVYETKKSVDLTGGQLSLAHLHKITLLKPHLVEQLKIYLVLFDISYRNLMLPSMLPFSSHTGEPTRQHFSESGDDDFKSSFT